MARLPPKLQFIQLLLKDPNRDLFARLTDGRFVMVDRAYSRFSDGVDEIEVCAIDHNGLRNLRVMRQAWALSAIGGLKLGGLAGELVWSNSTKSDALPWWPKLQERNTTASDQRWTELTCNQILAEARKLALEHIMMRLKDAGVSPEMLSNPDRRDTIDYHVASIMDKVSASCLASAGRRSTKLLAATTTTGERFPSLLLIRPNFSWRSPCRR